MSAKWKIPAILASIHLLPLLILFVCVEMSPDGEAVMGWVLFSWIDFPTSALVEAVDHCFWRNELLWYDSSSATRRFAQALGFDHLNVGAAILYFIAGTIQWGAVGFCLRAFWHRR